MDDSQIGFQQSEAGYYSCKGFGLEIYLIAINELPMAPVYYSLLLFASSKVRSQELIEEIVKNERMEYLAYAYQLHPELTEEISKMADRYTRNLEYIAQNMGQDLLPYISSEDRVRGLSVEDRIKDLSDEERHALLNKLLAAEDGLTPAQRLEGLTLEDIPPEDIVNRLSNEKRQAIRQLLDDQENGT